MYAAKHIYGSALVSDDVLRKVGGRAFLARVGGGFGNSVEFSWLELGYKRIQKTYSNIQ